MVGAKEKWLFWACFIALITTAFGFIVRAMIIDEWATDFGLSETQKGEIQGVGLWPFAVSIILFSMVVDGLPDGGLVGAAALELAIGVVCMLALLRYRQTA